MRLQVIDPTIQFACSSCTRCCDQPWRTLVESEKLAAIEAFDWPAAFPDMSGRPLYHTRRQGGRTIHELGKGQGTRCVFLHDDGKCRIHMTLGYDAKPHMCKQFPYFSVRGWEGDFVSANYGCRAIQELKGPPVAEQADAVAAAVPLSDAPCSENATYYLTREKTISQSTMRAILDHLGRIAMAEETPADDGGPTSIAGRLALMLDLVERLSIMDEREMHATIERHASHAVEAERYTPFASAAQAPMQSRFLFAATLYPDTLPADTAGDLGLVRRLTLIPRLMTLAQMSGGYASRLLGRNVRVDEILGRAASMDVTPDATALLGRYLRSRLWQHFPAGTRLPLLSAIHQHILDMNAIVFFAVAEAADGRKTLLDLHTVQRALMHVEFHLANQPRLYQSVLKGWLKGALADTGLAWASLRMLRCTCEPSAPVAQTTAGGAARTPRRR